MKIKKRSMTTHPVTGILPEELMMEIIVRIPVRFLVRLRFVCKSWHALITDPQFALKLNDRNKNTQQKILFLGRHSNFSHGWSLSSDREYVALFCLNEQPRILYDNNSGYRRPDFRNLNFHDCFRDCVVAGSVNGIVCLSFNGFAALWNPVINYWKPIRLLPNTRDDGPFESIGLAFDSLANDYKVIRLVPLCGLQTYSSLSTSRVEVYSANQDSWLVVYSQFPVFTIQPNCSHIVKGVPYWSRNDEDPKSDSFEDNFIVSVDPHTGLCKKISYPKIVLNEKTSLHPFNYMDSLALLIYSPGEKPNQTFQVYALDDENSCATTWTNIYSTVAPTILLNKTINIHFCFENAGKTVVVGWNPYQNATFLYDLKSNCVIDSTGLDAFRPSWDKSYHHVESLVFIPGMEPIHRTKNWTSGLSSACNCC